MTDITVKDFSKTVGLPVNRLMDQLELAGVNKKNENDLISDEEKMQLLNYVRNNQNTKYSFIALPSMYVQFPKIHHHSTSMRDHLHLFQNY